MNHFVKKLLITTTVCLMLCLSVSAHSGRTDSSGGHKDNFTGEYHYHHGKPAHQHPGGVCPYSEKSIEQRIEKAKQETKESSAKTKPQSKTTDNYNAIAFGVPAALAAGGAYLYFKKKD